MHLQRKRQMKYLLQIQSTSRFWWLILLMYLDFLLWLGASKGGSGPGVSGPLKGPVHDVPSIAAF
jgi:hypothetical protein